jgi:hypothetical protein
MPKYLVNVYETLQHTVIIYAENRQDAIEAGYDAVMNDTEEYDTESCGTTEAIATEIESGE